MILVGRFLLGLYFLVPGLMKFAAPEMHVALMEAQSSWVAKWQRIVTFVPGIYALEVTGRLPDDAIEACENGGYEIRSDVNR
jgi:uncharacterized membrane protein YphA (DoxX/SURF4 family)